MILKRVKRLLQSVEEASSHQIAADLGVEHQMTEAALEHLLAMGKVACRRRTAGAGECRERVTCASCPLVKVCDPKAPASGGYEPREVVYAWL